MIGAGGAWKQRSLASKAAMPLALAAAMVLLIGVLAVGVLQRGKGDTQDIPRRPGVPTADAGIDLPNVDVDSETVLADGAVSDDEMVAGLNAVSDCVHDSGFEAALILNGSTVASGWSFDVPSDSAAQTALVACRAAALADIEPTYFLQGGARTDATDRSDRVLACLEDQGVVSGASASQAFLADPNAFATCDALAGAGNE